MIAETAGLTKRFDGRLVLSDVSLSVRSEDAAAILGPSGCGKTTLLRILLGLETYDEGTVESALQRSGYVPQETLLLPWKTVLANVELPLQIRGVRAGIRKRKVLQLLPRFGLEGYESSYPRELSGGMRQRAALLRAVVAGARSLVLDEPFASLDMETRQDLQEWLLDLARELHPTLLLVTHDVEEAVVLCDRVIALSRRPGKVLGEVRIDLPVEDRKGRYGTPFLAARDRVARVVRGGGER